MSTNNPEERTAVIVCRAGAGYDQSHYRLAEGPGVYIEDFPMMKEAVRIPGGFTVAWIAYKEGRLYVEIRLTLGTKTWVEVCDCLATDWSGSQLAVDVACEKLLKSSGSWSPLHERLS